MEKKKQYIKCNLCSENNEKKLFKLMGYSIVQCNECGLLYVTQRLQSEPTKEKYGSSYWTGGTNYGDKKGYIKNSWRKKLRFRYLLNQVKKIKRGGKILDIGCGIGIFLKLASDYGYDVYGVDISEFASNYAKNNFGLNVYSGVLEKANFKDNFFDIITAFDVLSHLENPLNTFKEIDRILKKDGVFIFQTGNFSRLPEYLYRDIWGNPTEHLCAFNDKSLEKLLLKSNLKIIAKKTGLAVLPIPPRALEPYLLKPILSFLNKTLFPVVTHSEIYICQRNEE